MKKIKVLKDTPFNMKDDVISVKEYREKYKYSIVDVVVPDEEILEYIQHERDAVRNNPVTISKKPFMGEFFEVVEIQDPFKAGDWVFNEHTKKAVQIINFQGFGNKTWPNHATIDAVNEFSSIYKRLATTDEIRNETLLLFDIGSYQFLVGKGKMYLFENTWKEVRGVGMFLYNFKKAKELFGTGDGVGLEGDVKPEIKLNVKVGCLYIDEKSLEKIYKVFIEGVVL
jgi:hypothetical protein